MKEMNSFGGNNLVHYEGILGIFDYDPEEFEVRKIWYHEYLHYHGNGKSVDLPEGCTDTSYMFSECKLPEGFSLGENFNTGKVTYMEHMFSCCKLPKGFSLGEHFDTSNVTYMHSMFRFCKIPDDFSLGEHFDTSKVTNMRRMFGDCRLPEGFSLGAHFYTSNVTDMSFMFSECKLPEGFSLGEHFAIDRGTDVLRMFVNCKYKGVDAYDYFETQDAEEIITKLRKYKKSEDIVVDNELTALMLSVSEELQLSTSIVQRMMKSYLKSLINK